VELENPSISFKPVADKRRHMPEPPPVRVVAVEDLHLCSGAGLEVQLDDFYMSVLQFERDSAPEGQIVYKGENFRLVFTVVEPPVLRDDLRPVGIEVPSLVSVRERLTEREIEYEFHRGLMAGQETFLLQDPAGNWVQIGMFRRV
jgi:hypothetical protein